MNETFRSALLAAALLLLPSNAAAIPTSMAFAARVADSGAPVTGDHAFTFKLFDGATEVWTETHAAVTVTQGVAHVLLGSVNPLAQELFTGAALSLEVTFDGTLLSPRLQLASVPYAIRAASANAVPGLTQVVEGEGTDVAATTGVNLADPTALGGVSRFAGGGTPSGVLFTATQSTPGVGGRLAIGLTRATFRLKVTNRASTSAITTISCKATRAGGGAPTTLASRVLRPADFATSLAWATFTLYCEFLPDDVTQEIAADFANAITDLSIDYVQLQAVTGAGVPKSAVMTFNLAACPEGWSELAGARGRAIVGLPSGGTLAGTRGAAVGNLWSLAAHSHTYDTAISHNHGINDPGHYHTLYSKNDDFNCSGDAQGEWGIARCRDNAGFNWPTSYAYATASYTGINSTNFAGSGSAATWSAGEVPYIQLLVCQKD